MTLQIVPWIFLAASIVSFAIGCRDWLGGRDRKLALAAVPSIAMATMMVLGDGHPVWRNVCRAVMVGFTIYVAITLRKRIRWTSPTILFFGAAIALIPITELANDVVSGFPKPILIALMSAIVASIVMAFVTMYRDPFRTFRR